MESKKLKILIFDGSFTTTAFINNLIYGLSSNNQVYVLGFNENLNRKISGVNYTPLGSNSSLYRFFIVSLINAFRGKYTFLFLSLFFTKKRKLIQELNIDFQLKQINPDIIHIQWPSNIVWFEDYLKHSSYNFVLSLRGYHINVRPFVNEDNKRYLQEWIPYFNGIHGVSNAILKNLDLLNVKASDSLKKTIYSGHIIPSMRETKNSWQPKSVPEFLLVGRDHWIKNYTLVLQYAKVLKNLNINYKFIFVGFNKSDSEEIHFTSNQLEIDEYIEFIPKQNSDQLRHLYISSDALILPSMEEGIANVCIEAMSLRLPVISFNVGGMSELITHLESGLLIEELNIKGLDKSVRLFLSMSEREREGMANRAYDVVSAKFNSELMIREFNSFYREIING